MNGNKWFLLVVIGAALILGAASLALAQDDNAAIFEKFIDGVLNKRHFYDFNLLVSPDIVHHDATLVEPVTGNKALVQYVQKYQGELPDIEFTVGNVTTEGDQVTAELTAMLNDISMPLAAKARIADGKLVETWFDVNALVTNPDIEAAVAQVEADNLAVVGLWIEVMENPAAYVGEFKQYAAKAGDLYGSSYLEHDLFGDGYTSSASSDYAWFHSIVAAFPDVKWTFESVIAHGDRVFMHYTSTGTFENPWELPGVSSWIALQPTGKKVVESGVIIYRLEHGKLVEGWWYQDSPALWSEVALLLNRGSSLVSSVTRGIYDLNKPK